MPDAKGFCQGSIRNTTLCAKATVTHMENTTAEVSIQLCPEATLVMALGAKCDCFNMTHALSLTWSSASASSDTLTGGWHAHPYCNAAPELTALWLIRLLLALMRGPCPFLLTLLFHCLPLPGPCRWTMGWRTPSWFSGFVLSLSNSLLSTVSPQSLAGLCKYFYFSDRNEETVLNCTASALAQAMSFLCM